MNGFRYYLTRCFGVVIVLCSFISIGIVNSFAVTPTDSIPVSIHVLDPTKEKIFKDTFSGGPINPATAPQINGYRFYRAYVIDRNNPNNLLQLSAVNLDPQHCGSNASDNTSECNAILTVKNVDDTYVQLYVPREHAADNIIFEYIEVAKTVHFTYQINKDNDCQSVTYVGPSYSSKNSSGDAIGYVTVRSPRDCTPNVSADNGATWKEVNDLSTPENTVKQFEITTKQDTTITYTAHKNSAHILTWNGVKPEDWKAGVGYNYKYRDTLFSYPNFDCRPNAPDTNSCYADQSNSSSPVIDDGGSTVFYLFHDKLLNGSGYGSNMLGEAFSVVLADIKLNHQTFAAPQPAGRFGSSKYPANSEMNQKPSPHAPWNYFEKGFFGWGRLEKRLPWLENPLMITSFTESEGWDPWNNDWTKEMGWGTAYSWWLYNVAKKIIKAKTISKVESGPLAGATVTIEITDALPWYATRQLNDYPDNDPDRNSRAWWNAGECKNIDKATGRADGKDSDDMNGQDHAWCNSLRYAYKVTINNIHSDISVDTEWARTNNTKIGVYTNYGVSNLQVYATQLNHKTEPGGSQRWLSNANGSWIDGGALSGAEYNSSMKTVAPWLQNPDPTLKIRGDVENGYIDPEFQNGSLSTTVRDFEKDGRMIPDMPLCREGDSNSSSGKNCPERHTSDKTYGFSGQYSMFAYGASEGNRYLGSLNSIVFFGGMNIVGVRAHLFNVPVSYDLRGGTTQNVEAFPSDGDTAHNLYNVESKPIIHIPDDIPTRNGNSVIYWELLRKQPDGSLLPASNNHRTYLPGDSIDIRNVSDVGKLSNEGGYKLLDSFVLKAVYPDDRQINGNTFKVLNVFYDETGRKLFEHNVSSFIGLQSLWARLTPAGIAKYFPERRTVCIMGENRTVIPAGSSCGGTVQEYVLDQDHPVRALYSNADKLENKLELNEQAVGFVGNYRPAGYTLVVQNRDNQVMAPVNVGDLRVLQLCDSEGISLPVVSNTPAPITKREINGVATYSAWGALPVYNDGTSSNAELLKDSPKAPLLDVKKPCAATNTPAQNPVITRNDADGTITVANLLPGTYYLLAPDTPSNATLYSKYYKPLQAFGPIVLKYDEHNPTASVPSGGTLHYIAMYVPKQGMLPKSGSSSFYIWISVGLSLSLLGVALPWKRTREGVGW